MKAIYKKELRSYFASPIGYVLIAFMALIVGIYFTAYNLRMHYSWFGTVLNYTTFIFLIVVPLMTMRMLAEERRSKTDQLLFTAPIRIIDVVLGKYLALLTVFAIPMALFCLYPLILLQFQKDPASLAMDYTGILAFFLLGAANLSIGLFLSSTTENPIVAAAISFGVLLVLFFVGSIAQLIPSSAGGSLVVFTVMIVILALILFAMTKSFIFAGVFAAVAEVALLIVYLVKSSLLEGSVASLLSIFDISSRTTNMLYGQLDFTAIIYFVSISGLFVFLTVQSIQKRRWS